MTLLCLPWRVTNASLGYRRLTLLVNGTTCTRFKYLLAASLLRMTAGRCLRISPPTDGSKLTHQTSPRFIADITDCGFCPGKRFGFTRFILRHLLIGRFQLVRQDVWTDEFFDKATDTSTANDSMKAVVHGLVEGDRKLFLHKDILQEVYVLYTYSSSSWNAVKENGESSQR